MKEAFFSREYLQDVGQGPLIELSDSNHDWDHLSSVTAGILVRRNELIQNLVEYISKFDENRKKLLHVYGSENNGKKDLVNYACRHALDGRVDKFNYAISIDLNASLLQEKSSITIKDAII